MKMIMREIENSRRLDLLAATGHWPTAPNGQRSGRSVPGMSITARWFCVSST
jgi:hypothetical protein